MSYLLDGSADQKYESLGSGTFFTFLQIFENFDLQMP